MTMHVILRATFISYAVLLSLHSAPHSLADETEDRHELVATLDACSNWLGRLEAYQAKITQQRWVSEDEKGLFVHSIRKYQLLLDKEREQAYEAISEATEYLELENEKRSLQANTRLVAHSNDLFTFVNADSQPPRVLTANKPFVNFSTYSGVQLSWFPISIGLVENRKPADCFAAEINMILSPKKNSSVIITRELLGEKRLIKYQLIGRASNSFGMIEYIFDETDRQRPLLESKRSVLSKLGRVNYQNEDDIAYVQHEIKAEYEFNEELGVKIPVRVSATINHPAGSWEKLETRESIRMLTTIEWSKPTEKTLDIEKLTKLVEGFRDELEAQFR